MEAFQGAGQQVNVLILNYVFLYCPNWVDISPYTHFTKDYQLDIKIFVLDPFDSCHSS